MGLVSLSLAGCITNFWNAAKSFLIHWAHCGPFNSCVSYLFNQRKIIFLMTSTFLRWMLGCCNWTTSAHALITFLQPSSPSDILVGCLYSFWGHTWQCLQATSITVLEVGHSCYDSRPCIAGYQNSGLLNTKHLSLSLSPHSNLYYIYYNF